METKSDRKEKKLADWPTWITAISTIVLAIYAVISHIDTNLILKQQRLSNETQFRAYLSLASINVINIGKDSWQVNLAVKNSGTTPAYNVKMNFSKMTNGVMGSSQSMGAVTDVINPGEDKILHGNFTTEYLKGVEENSNNFLDIVINYEDYAKNEHTRTETLDSEWGTNNTVDLGIYSGTDDR